MDQPNSVYRYYDHAGRLIYVGITARGQRRQKEHNETSTFWPHVTSQQVEHYPTRDEALRVERELIKVYRPPFNKVHNENWEPIQAAYLAVVAAEDFLAKAQRGEDAEVVQQDDDCRPGVETAEDIAREEGFSEGVEFGQGAWFRRWGSAVVGLSALTVVIDNPGARDLADGYYNSPRGRDESLDDLRAEIAEHGICATSRRADGPWGSVSPKVVVE